MDRETTQGGRQDGGQGNTQANNDTPQGTTQAPQDTTQGDVELSAIETCIFDQMRINPSVSQSKIAENLDCKVDQIKYYVNRLKDKGILSREGSQQKGHWIVNPDIEDQ
ncbi:MAG: hypothetical protein PUC75_09010 [Lachnospiraceae bacterium]|nr:hypothetical protein [Lachnospiraceae bacterium]